MFLNPDFKRDRSTWFAYSMAAFFAYMQASLGPLMPFLRSELGIGYAVAGLHFSAFACGMIIAGSVSTRLYPAWGRHVVLWGGAIGMAVGALVLAFSHQVALTILSALVMGLLGSTLHITVQAGLSDQHLEHRPAALTEMNAAASMTATLAPLLIGGFAQFQLGWRSALLSPAIVLGLAFVRCRHVPFPQSRSQEDEDEASTQPLPKSFWGYWAAMFFGVSAGYCLKYWGADFLNTAVGLSQSSAASVMGVFLFSGFVGRIAGSRLSSALSSELLLLGAVGTTAVGFPLFWLGSSPPLNILGLFVAGLGTANFYPLILTNAIDASTQQSNRATARLSIGAGTAILSAPFLLGWIADQIPLKAAFGLVIILLMATAGVSVFANRLKRQGT